MTEMLKFATNDEALKYLAEVTGKKVLVAENTNAPAPDYKWGVNEYDDKLMRELDGETAGPFGIFYEHPGFIQLVADWTDDSVIIAATPLWEGENSIDVQITDPDGKEILFLDINFEARLNDVKYDAKLYKQKIEEHAQMIKEAVEKYKEKLNS